jgi:c-di-GMP-binding flagellar brake protein YcgR
MEERQKIQGKSIFNILTQLRNDRTFVNMHILDTDFEHLTIITGIRPKNNPPLFRIDHAEGLREAIADTGKISIHFEFTGKDKTLHTFRTSGGEIHTKEIWIRFPDVIERIQRREHFRLRVPMGTKLFFGTAMAQYEMDVIDVSVGGVLGVFVNLKKEIEKDSNLAAGKILGDLRLVFPSEKEDLGVHIKGSLVKRVEKDSQTKRYRYALQFTAIEKGEEKALLQIIYRFQREFLRKRLPIHR